MKFVTLMASTKKKKKHDVSYNKVGKNSCYGKTDNENIFFDADETESEHDCRCFQDFPLSSELKKLSN